MNKKAISPVIATILLLSVSMFAVVSFNLWFNNFSSTSYLGAETTISSSNMIEINAITNDYIYIISNSDQNISLNNSIIINNQRCDIEANLTRGMNGDICCRMSLECKQ